MTAPPPPPQKKSSLPRPVLIAIITIATLGVLGIGAVFALLIWANDELERDISYEVSGTAKAVRIQYQDEEARQTLDAVVPPWNKSFHTEFMTSRANVIASLPQGETGTLTCTLKINGKVVATATTTPTTLGVVHCVEPE